MKEPRLYRVVRPLVSGLFKLIYKPTIVGIENIPKSEAVILAGNHTKWLDPLLLISSNKRVVHFLGKHTLFKGFKGPIFRGMGVIPVNRTIKDKNCMIEAENVLNSNMVIGIFPEGTINRTNDIIMPFKMGAIKMASDKDAYIVPFSITGPYKPFKRSIKLVFDKPYKVKSSNLEDERKILEKKVIKLLKENK